MKETSGKVYTAMVRDWALWVDNWSGACALPVVSDNHGNRNAFEAVLCTAATWLAGVVGNTDEMLFSPASLKRVCERMIVANTGSVSPSHDGDRRAAYLLLEGTTPLIRRVEYDVDRELNSLSRCSLPHADWVAGMLGQANPSPYSKPASPSARS